MKRVLVYGDSNSWGFLDDGDGIRSPNRWPQVMADGLAKTGNPIALIEECLPGRKAQFGDPFMHATQPEIYNGAAALPGILLSHQPLDHVIIMLGTNDLKARFDVSAAEIVASIMQLAAIVRETPCGQGPWVVSHDLARVEQPKITIVCPPALGARAEEADWDRADEWTGGRDKSLELPELLQAACAQNDLGFLDANQWVQSSDLDPIHWDEANQIKMGQGMAGALT